MYERTRSRLYLLPTPYPDFLAPGLIHPRYLEDRQKDILDRIRSLIRAIFVVALRFQYPLQLHPNPDCVPD